MALKAAVFDLDRTLVTSRFSTIVLDGLRDAGLLPEESLPGERWLVGTHARLGETLPTAALARSAARAARGWSQAAVQEVGRQVVPALVDAVDPVMLGVVEDQRAQGAHLVLATGALHDLVAPVGEALGFDTVVATHARVDDAGAYDGRVDGEFVWGNGKARAVRVELSRHWIDPADAGAWSDSIFDLPLLTMVGRATAVNPDPRLAAVARLRGWPIVGPAAERSSALVAVDAACDALLQPSFLPWLRFVVEAPEDPPAAPVVFASSHRSRLDAAMVVMGARRHGHRVRVVSDDLDDLAPGLDVLSRSIGVIPPGDEPEAAALEALARGESVLVFRYPLGRPDEESEAPARLARAAGVELVPVEVEGSERAWPIERPFPYVLELADPPVVRVRLGWSATDVTS